jgi:hypothetical protein
MAFSHASDDITLGRGEVYFDPFTTGTTRSGEFKYMGNTPAVALSAATTKLDHFSSDRGLRVKDKSVVLEVNYTGSLETDNMDFGNLAKFFLGATSTVTQSSATAVNEDWTTVAAKTLLQLGVTSGNPQGSRNVTAVVVMNGVATLVLGTDYELDAATGTVHMLTAQTAVDITYNVPATTWDRTVSGGTEVKGALKIISYNPEGTKKDILLPYVTLSPNGDLALKGDDWLKASFNLEVLALNSTTSAVYIDGRPA